MVVNYMINHHQLIYQNKFTTLMSLYGVEEDTPDPHRGWVAPISFKQYLCLLLCHDFWGDEVVLYTISCMWSMKITIINMKTLQEYRICHDCHLDQVDAAVTYNTDNHFNAAGIYVVNLVVTL